MSRDHDPAYGPPGLPEDRKRREVRIAEDLMKASERGEISPQISDIVLSLAHIERLKIIRADDETAPYCRRECERLKRRFDEYIERSMRDFR